LGLAFLARRISIFRLLGLTFLARRIFFSHRVTHAKTQISVMNAGRTIFQYILPWNHISRCISCECYFEIYLWFSFFYFIIS
jgi:hypothetical protein